AASTAGVPHADAGLADKGFERLVIGHQLVEGEALDDKPVDQITAQPLRPVEQLREELRQPPVLVVDDADLAHPVAVAGREWVGDDLGERTTQMHLTEMP